MNGRVLFLALLSLLVATGATNAQQVRLKANLQAPVSNPYYGMSLVRFKEQVERLSRNEIAIEIHDKGELFREDEVVGAIASGDIDIGIAAAHNFARKVPAVAIMEQPFLFNFDDLVRAAASPQSEVRRLVDDAILKGIGARVLWWQSLGDNVFFSKGRDLADPERAKDQAVGTTGPSLAEFAAWCGANPSVLPADRLPVALRSGGLDVALVALEALEEQKLWTVTDTITRTAHAPIELLLAINQQTWESLSPAHRAVIAEVAQTVEREQRERTAELEARAYAMASIKGVKVRDLTPDQVADWRACSAEMLVDYMEKNGDLARRLMDAYGRLRAGECCAAPDGVQGGFTRH